MMQKQPMRYAINDRQRDGQLITQALLQAGKQLGLSQAELGLIVGRDRSALQRGLAADSKAAELALLLIRCHQALVQLCGADNDWMRHWLHTPNHDTGGTPAKQLREPLLLGRITDYLEACSELL